MLDEQAGGDHAALHGLVLKGLQVPEWQIISLRHRGGNVEPVPHLPSPANMNKYIRFCLEYFLDILEHFLEYFQDFLEYFQDFREYSLDFLEYFLDFIEECLDHC